MHKDGPYSGQSVPHVHVHIIPRHRGDYPNNDLIYDNITFKSAELLELLRTRRTEHDIESKERADRDQCDMESEALELRLHMKKLFPEFENKVSELE